MSAAYPARPIGAGGHGGGAAVARGAADWLSLAAAPAFVTMALMTVALGGEADPLCSAAHAGSPFGGMVAMYLLMGAFHSGAWLRLIASWRS